MREGPPTEFTEIERVYIKAYVRLELIRLNKVPTDNMDGIFDQYHQLSDQLPDQSKERMRLIYSRAKELTEKAISSDNTE